MGFLIGTFLTLFVIACVFLIFFVLIQAGKSGNMSLMGGASQTPFGASGADLLTKITRGLAISFIVLSLVLSFLFAKKEDKLLDSPDSPSELMAPPEETKSTDTPQPSNATPVNQLPPTAPPASK